MLEMYMSGLLKEVIKIKVLRWFCVKNWIFEPKFWRNCYLETPTKITWTKIFKNFEPKISRKILTWNFWKHFAWNFWKNLDFYDFLWTNVSAEVHDLVSLLVTFLSIGKRQILDIAKIGFQIEVSKWRFDWLFDLKTFLMNSELTIITLKSLLPNSPNKISTMSTKCWLLSKFLIKNQRLDKVFGELFLSQIIRWFDQLKLSLKKHIRNLWPLASCICLHSTFISFHTDVC